MPKLSVIIIARDEERNISACLESVDWVDEIIVVVDSRSVDRTETIARAHTSHVFIREWQGYGASKNFALEQATGDWVFWIDADEVMPDDLRSEIQQVLAHPGKNVGFEVPRLAYFLGRWIRHSGWYPGYVLRLFRRISGQFNTVLVHEGIEIQGPIGRLEQPLLHYTDPDTKNYFRKFDLFTGLAAQELFDRQKKFRIIDLIFRPLILFCKMYFLKAGFLDGIQGLILAVFSANYVFTKYARLWELRFSEAKQPDWKI